MADAIPEDVWQASRAIWMELDIINHGESYEAARIRKITVVADAIMVVLAARLRTELEAAKGDAVGVKALEWTKAMNGDPFADSIVGRYRIWPKLDGTFNVGLRGGDDFYLTFDELEAAKAAAKADFARRIRSALTADKSEAEAKEVDGNLLKAADGLSVSGKDFLVRRLASNIGLEIVDDPEHPDSPHARAKEEQIREDERDRLLEATADWKLTSLKMFLISEGAMLSEERARSRAQEAKP